MDVSIESNTFALVLTHTAYNVVNLLLSSLLLLLLLSIALIMNRTWDQASAEGMYCSYLQYDITAK